MQPIRRSPKVELINSNRSLLGSISISSVASQTLRIHNRK
ncbi:Hypothetical protein Cul210931_1950 [Corynebacterium ulcerans]|nr:Hypothetical protein Cul210931_1950 [Corynebacterium ulcerans]